MSKIISIQPGQPGEGMNYNVKKPLPYPYHMDTATGDVRPGPQTNNESWRLIGFQVLAGYQQVALRREDFVADPQKAVGMYPVFVDADGGMFNLDVPVTHVSEHEKGGE